MSLCSADGLVAHCSSGYWDTFNRCSDGQTCEDGMCVQKEGYLGCYYDDPKASSRPMEYTVSLNDNNLTSEKCTTICKNAGYNFAGVENGSQCFCSKKPPGNIILPANFCDTPCTGNNLAKCGGTHSMNVFQVGCFNGGCSPTGAWNFGCRQDLVDGSSNHVMEYTVSLNDPDLSIEKCMSECQSAGFAFVGLESGAQCFCSNKVPTKYAQTCNTPCSGNRVENCGGTNGALSVYGATCATGSASRCTNDGMIVRCINGYWDLGLCAMGATCSNGQCTPLPHYLGCYADLLDGRTRVMEYTAAFGDPNMSIENCATRCYAAAPQQGSSNCGMTCSGKASETCGGSNALAVYGVQCTTGSVTCSGQGYVLSCVKGFWQYSQTCFGFQTCQNGYCVMTRSIIGCKADLVDGSTRAMEYTISLGDSGMTIESCVAACQNAGYYYAGLESGNQCFCSTNIPRVDSTACNMLCAGRSSETCGGTNALSVFGVACPVGNGDMSVCSAGNQGVLRCRSGDFWGLELTCDAGQACQHVSLGDSNMSIESCISSCVNGGYFYARLENGNQCFCSRQLPTVHSSSCNVYCASNYKEYCGGANALSVYAVSCTSGSLQCSSRGEVMKCVNGSWQTTFMCKPGQSCQNGAGCVPNSISSLGCKQDLLDGSTNVMEYNSTIGSPI
ncbi:hypothetical protein HDU76_002467 [Blyttiomyces sp. JEL0837]|nr:hypothetical protein HDU76_002467 [Blyttiomyces sp. JEL0837]